MVGGKHILGKPKSHRIFGTARVGERFGDPAAPLSVITVSAEGAVTYKALLYIPSQAPSQYYTEDYKPGLQLYASGVMIMDSCADLLPDYFNFVRGVVESPDLSLNISRELLQHDRQLKIISGTIGRNMRPSTAALAAS